MNIELRHLRYFVAVAEELHYGRASQRLNISQPSLSQQIMQLEQETKVLLFQRTNRRVKLTPAGKQLLEDARMILQQVVVATERAARLHQGEEGELRIGFTSSALFNAQVSEALFQFRQRWPQVHINMQEINTRQQIAPLHTGQLDLGIMRNTLLPPDMEHRVLMREPLCAVVHKDHPLAEAEKVSLRMLTDEPFIFFDPQCGTALYDEIINLLHSHLIKPTIAQEAGEAMTILALVATGLGISILPASFQRARLPDIVWLPLKDADAFSELWLVWSRVDEPSEQLNNMMQLLKTKK